MIIKDILKKILPIKIYRPHLINLLYPNFAKILDKYNLEERHAGTSEFNCYALMKLIKQNPNINTSLEIGFAKGFSAASIIYAKKKYSNNPKMHHAIDPFYDDVWKSAGINLLEKLNLKDNLKIYKDPSYIILPLLTNKKNSFDLIYIDGSHNFDFAFVDFFFSDILINQCGYIVFDDLLRKEIKKIKNFIKINKSEDYEEINLLKLIGDDDINFFYKLYLKMFPNIFILRKVKNKNLYSYNNF